MGAWRIGNAMLKWWAAQRQQDRELALRIAEIESRSAERSAELMTAAIVKMAETNEANLAALSTIVASATKQSAQGNELIQTWLKSFQVTTPPESSAMNDEDERNAYLAAARDPDAPPEVQLAAMLKRFDELA